MVIEDENNIRIRFIIRKEISRWNEKVDLFL